jgi:hypothetical protein
VELETTVGQDGKLSFTIEPAAGAKNWEIVQLEIRPRP